MITLKRGNLLEADVEALVNTVNCVGHMGKGIALQFKKGFPENFKAYQRACRAEEVRPGRMFVFPTGRMVNPRFIINFPTKRHWRGKSRIEDIADGLEDLVEVIRQHEISSVAVPPLGCGLGGLDWAEVRPLIEGAFAGLDDVQVTLFEPAGAPSASAMPVGTERPHLTIARALFIRLMAQYSLLAYRLTLLEMQKLAYFLQEGGEPLRLSYEAGHYGPYAHNLNKVFEVLEGHFIRGYGDSQKPDVEIELLAGAMEEADDFLKAHEESTTRLRRVADLIDGFETPYGMELLSSVHWVAVHSKPRPSGDREVVGAVHGWNNRKRNMFKEEHIKTANHRLQEQGWIPGVE
ncbi:MAG: macro domain-containing protein [Candidatus Schekmanbacteria bacterium]|nr:macro domain-containing protein [Candidatus Schekmanbacteria bacterium]